MKVYFNGERMKIKKRKLTEKEREFAQAHWDNVVRLAEQKGSKLKARG